MLDRIHYTSRTLFIEKVFNGKYPVRVPAYMLEASYGTGTLFDHYEERRLASMAELLHKDDILFDIGSETGWLSALYGRYFVKPENICLFEPSDVQWPTIKAIWEANGLATPRDTWFGFIGDKDRPIEHAGYEGGWPKVALGPFLNEQNQFRGVRERPDIPAITIDTFVRERGIYPTAITLDIEGAEFLAMRGAYETLKNLWVPKIWMSIHMHPEDGFTGNTQDLQHHIKGPLLYDYHDVRSDLLTYMEDLGYTYTYLGYDHEEHWLFLKE